MKIEIELGSEWIGVGDIVEYDLMTCMVVGIDAREYVEPCIRFAIVELEDGHIIEFYKSLADINNNVDIKFIARSKDMILKYNKREEC